MSRRALPGCLVLLGHPVSHSLSPRMQNAALRAAGIPLTYAAMDVAPDALGGVLSRLAAEQGAGNVTIPHKAAVAVACAAVTSSAARIGAVNTFWTESGRLTGDNTDIAGFDALARSVIGGAPARARVALLGAGGAAAAVCAAVERWSDCTVVIRARNRSRAETLAARFPLLARIADSEDELLSGSDMVVNATPVGMDDGAFPVRIEALPRDAAVMDLVYRRGETAWVRAARAAGHRAADGLAMLVAQGARAFECWFGIPPDEAAMRAAVDT